MSEGFTLLEILLVIALISIVAGVVILAINPSKQLADARNATRRQDVNTIINAIYQHAIDNNGVVSSAIPTSATCSASTTNEICVTGGTCSGLVDLSALTTTAKYLVSMPVDPSDAGGNGTGYFLKKDSTTLRVTVCAPSAEQSASISVTR